jgi:uncharacterized membrane protein
MMGRIILLLVAVVFLVFQFIRLRRKAWKFPNWIPDVAVALGIFGLFLDSFSLAGSQREAVMNIAGALIIGGIALDLLWSAYLKAAGRQE